MASGLGTAQDPPGGAEGHVWEEKHWKHSTPFCCMDGWMDR